MRIAVIGATGQVGTDVVSAARAGGCEVLRLTHADVDVTDREAIEASLSVLTSADAVVNTAAFHRTDECERHPDRAMAVNALGAYHVAAAAYERGAAVVFLSSDFVFDGEKRTPYVESDAPRPINAYGVSKIAGEMLVQQANSRYYVARISSVFGVAGSSGKGGNFVETMLAKSAGDGRIEVVDDIVMAPTFAADAAALIVSLVTKRAPFGTYHLANDGSCSWHEFANAIFELSGASTRAAAVHARTPRGAARRPPYSVLASERLATVGLAVRPWREALRAYLSAKG